MQNAAQEPEDTGSAALVTQDGGTAEGITDRIPDAAWNIIMVVAVVIGAVVLMLVLLFLLGLYRRIRGRKHKNKTK